MKFGREKRGYAHTQKAAAFRAVRNEPGTFIIPNPWVPAPRGDSPGWGSRRWRRPASGHGRQTEAHHDQPPGPNSAGGDRTARAEDEVFGPGGGLHNRPILRALRQQQELSLEGLAARSGVSVSMLSTVELGRKVPSVLVMSQIATALDTSIGRLVGDVITTATVSTAIATTATHSASTILPWTLLVSLFRERQVSRPRRPRPERAIDLRHVCRGEDIEIAAGHFVYIVPHRPPVLTAKRGEEILGWARERPGAAAEPVRVVPEWVPHRTSWQRCASRAAIAASRENKRLWSLELDFHKSHRLVRPVHDVVLDPGRPVIGLPRG